MEQIAENVYVETGYEGVNVGAIVTRQGVIAIDVPSYPRQARDWAVRLQSFTLKPIQYVILTDYQGDRILNARWMNSRIIAHEETANKLLSYDKRFPAPLLESLAVRNPLRSREFNSSSVEKPAISFSKRMQILKQPLEIELIESPGPTSSNIWIYLPQKGIIFAGDTVTVARHPHLFEPTSKKWLNTLDRLKAWPNPIYTIVPGRGRIDSPEMIEPLREYLTEMRARIREHIGNGRSREETAVYIPEFLAKFPQHDLPLEWIEQQIKRSLDHVFDEIQTTLIQGNGDIPVRQQY